MRCREAAKAVGATKSRDVLQKPPCALVVPWLFGALRSKLPLGFRPFSHIDDAKPAQWAADSADSPGTEATPPVT